MHTPVNPPAGAPSIAALQAMLTDEIALPSRVRHVALLLVSLVMAVITSALLATEPAMPMRTRIALIVMVMVALSWIGFSLWVLTRRRVLYAQHRVVAGRMATVFSAIFVGGCALLGWTGQGGQWWLAGMACGAVMLALSIGVLLRASRVVRELAQRRTELEQALAHTRGAA